MLARTTDTHWGSMVAAERTDRAVRWLDRVAPGGGRGDESALLAATARGDAAAFRQLVDRHLAVVVAVARRILNDEAEAEDVAQETMLKLWNGAAGIEVGEAGVRPWLRRVAANQAIDRFRSRSRVDVTDEVPEVADAPQQERGLEAANRAGRVRQALDRLPERQRQALALFHFEGLSQIEVGKSLGISDEAVESLLARARRALKADLKDDWRELISDDE